MRYEWDVSVNQRARSVNMEHFYHKTVDSKIHHNGHFVNALNSIVDS